MTGSEFEEKFKRVFNRLREERGLSRVEVSSNAFDNREDPKQKYQRIFNEDGGLHLSDAFELAKAIKMSFLELISKVLHEPEN